MTLNLSHPSIFPTISSVEGLCPSIDDLHAVEGYPDENLDGLVNDAWDFNWVWRGSLDYMREKGERENSDDSVSDDILGILPADPFCMDVTATFTAISGWIEDFEKDWGSDSYALRADEMEVKSGDHGVFAGLKMFSDMFQSDRYNKGFLNDNEFGIGSSDGGACVSLNQEGNWAICDQANQFQDSSKLYPENDVGARHDALFFALGHLGVQDLFSVERVCWSLYNAVKNDPLPWRNIHIDQPSSDKITDDALLRLANRAQGTLQSLSLVGCLRITDSGLKRVFESIPGLTKLSVPGCVKLSVEGILYSLKALKSSGAPGIKHLRIGGTSSVTNPQFEELKFLLGVNTCLQLKPPKPQFYGIEQLDASCDDDRAIDIEICPKCQEVRLVYDCPAESCKGEHHPVQSCRACTLCIARCVHCINNCEYEETFCLDLLCLDCWEEILNDEEELEGNCTPLSKQTIFNRETTSYHFCFAATKD